MWGRIVKIALSLPFLIVAGLFGLYLVFGFFLIAPLASLERLYVNLDTTGLFRWAWRIRDVELDQPHATVEVRPGGALNWAALLAKLNEDKTPPSAKIARVLIDHIRIGDGHIV